MFARALRPPKSHTELVYVPYGRQVDFAERLGVEAIQGAKCFATMALPELRRGSQPRLRGS